MKDKVICGIIFSFFLTPAMQAQEVTPREGIIVHADAPRACWVVQLDPEPKTLKKAWKEYIKDDFDVSMKGFGFLANKDLLSAEEAVIGPVSPEPIHLYTHIVEDLNGSELKLFAEVNPGDYADRTGHAPAFRALRGILEDFLAAYLPTYYHGRVKDAEKRLVELAGEREDLKKEIARNTEKIKELEDEIEQRNLELQANQNRLELAESKLEARKEKLERIRNQLR